MAVQIFILTLLKRKHLIFSTAAQGHVLRAEWVRTQPPTYIVPDVYVDRKKYTCMKTEPHWFIPGSKKETFGPP